MEVCSISGSKYMLLFIDDYSRKVFPFFIKTNYAENQTDKHIKAIRSYNGTEFCKKKMKKLMVEGGIDHQTTVPYSP